MIKFKHGSITNPKTNETKEIIVKSLFPNKIADLVIGGVVTLLDIGYLTVTAFRNGSDKLEEAEFKTMCDLDIVKGDDAPQSK